MLSISRKHIGTQLRICSPSRIASCPSSYCTMAPKRAAPASPAASGSRKSARTSSSQPKAAPADAEDALEEQLPEIDDALLLAAAEEAERRASVPRSSQSEGQKAPGKAAAGLLADDADPLAMERRTMHPDWFGRLEKSMAAPSFKQLKSFLASEAKAGTTVYPPPELVHSWSRLTPPSNVKIVILGQDPYHGPGQACGTSFSVPRSVPAPPSLKNMYKELRAEYGNDFAVPTHGCLDGWAKQGVLLLNACLTVRAGAAASHHGKGWEPFTRAVLQAVAADAARAAPGAASGAKPAAAVPPKGQGTITGMFAAQKKKQTSDKGPQAVEEASASAPAADAAPSAPGGDSQKHGGVVFLAWGLPAAKSLADAGITDASPNVLVLKSAHPSPLSAHRGFFRAAATPKLPSLFKQANDWLEQPARRGPGGGVRWSEL